MVKIPKSVYTEATQTNIEIALERVSTKEIKKEYQGIYSFIKVKTTEKNNNK